MGLTVEKSIKLYIGEGGEHFHTIFLIPHSIKNPKWSGDKTICLTNIPPYITDENLARIFTKFGAIDKIALFTNIKDLQAFSQSPETSVRSSGEFKWKTAYIAFKMTSSTEKVLKAKKLIANDVVTGVSRWISEYKATYPSTDRLQGEIDNFMEKFDQEEDIAEREARKQSADEDGWIQVSRKSTKDAFKLTEHGIKSIEEKQNVRKKKKELKNFYRFQITESKKQKIMEMRRKFQEDKEKVEKMKTSRRFRPF
ncbi:Ribosomal RNA-processing protein 7 [Sergentomyia squamirostris]